MVVIQCPDNAVRETSQRLPNAPSRQGQFAWCRGLSQSCPCHRESPFVAKSGRIGDRRCQVGAAAAGVPNAGP